MLAVEGETVVKRKPKVRHFTEIFFFAWGLTVKGAYDNKQLACRSETLTRKILSLLSVFFIIVLYICSTTGKPHVLHLTHV